MTNDLTDDDFVVCNCQARTIYDCPELAEILRGGEYIILNLDGIVASEAQRVIDFMTGVASYACAKVKKLRGTSILFIPMDRPVLKPVYDEYGRIIDYDTEL